jgi:DNA-binding NarL/FixJ family response regulator
MSTMAKHGPLRALVEDLTVVEFARLVGIEVEELARLVLDGSDRRKPSSPSPARGPTDEVPPCAVSPAQLVDRLAQIGGLVGRQLDVARLLLLGESDRAIADQLGCSERTAKRAVADVLARCSVSNRASLMLVIFRDAGTL